MTPDDRLRAESAEIERMLEDIHERVPDPVWDHIEIVISRIVRLYGAGLGRAVAHARAGADGGSFDAKISDDDLLSGLLVLHGLHPLPIEARVQRALARVRTELGIGHGALELAGIHDGRVEIRTDVLGGGVIASRVVEAGIRRVIESVAPDAISIDILVREAA